MRISDWSSDVCSSDLRVQAVADLLAIIEPRPAQQAPEEWRHAAVPEIVERRADSFDEAADHAGIQSWSSFEGCADWSNSGRQRAPSMPVAAWIARPRDRKSTRLNSSH